MTNLTHTIWDLQHRVIQFSNRRCNQIQHGMQIRGYSFMLRSRNQTINQIPRSYKNDGFDWPFDLVIVTWKNNQIRNELEY